LKHTFLLTVVWEVHEEGREVALSIEVFDACASRPCLDSEADCGRLLLSLVRRGVDLLELASLPFVELKADCALMTARCGFHESSCCDLSIARFC
jgi:hypothetical protein